LKPENILLDKDCNIKVCDFGLARVIHQDDFYSDINNKNPMATNAEEVEISVDANKENKLTEYVVTRWYRAPEILLGSNKYTKGVDMWSLGCILAELLLGKPVFPGTSTLNQLDRVMEVIGRPS
jgi:mitogen-activated protein kinase 15